MGHLVQMAVLAVQNFVTGHSRREHPDRPGRSAPRADSMRWHPAPALPPVRADPYRWNG
jgi:hypothetical protein